MGAKHGASIQVMVQAVDNDIVNVNRELTKVPVIQFRPGPNVHQIQSRGNAGAGTVYPLNPHIDDRGTISDAAITILIPNSRHHYVKITLTNTDPVITFKKLFAGLSSIFTVHLTNGTTLTSLTFSPALKNAPTFTLVDTEENIFTIQAHNDGTVEEYRVIGSSGGGGSSPLTTKGDLFTFDTVDQRLGVGTNGQILEADSGQPTGLNWVDNPLPDGTVENEHLEWDNGAGDWLAVANSTYGATGPFATGARLNFENDTIIFAVRNAANTGNLELKINTSDFFDFTESNNAALTVHYRAQHAIDPDQTFSITQFSGTGGAAQFVFQTSLDMMLGATSIIDLNTTRVLLGKEIYMVNNAIQLDSDNDSGIISLSDDVVQIFINDIVRFAFEDTKATFGADLDITGFDITAGGAMLGMDNIGTLTFINNTVSPALANGFYSNGTDMFVRTNSVSFNLNLLGGANFTDAVFRITDESDLTKKMAFDVGAKIATGTTRTFTMPNANGEIMVSPAQLEFDLNTFDIFNIDQLTFQGSVGSLDVLNIGFGALDTTGYRANVLDDGRHEWTQENVLQMLLLGSTTFNTTTLTVQGPTAATLTLIKSNATLKSAFLSIDDTELQIESQQLTNFTINGTDIAHITSTSLQMQGTNFITTPQIGFSINGNLIEDDASGMTFTTVPTDDFTWDDGTTIFATLDVLSFNLNDLYILVQDIGIPADPGAITQGQIFFNENDNRLSFKRRNDGDTAWVVSDLEGGGGGEVNTASNVGTGVGKQFKTKVVADLQFKSNLEGFGIDIVDGSDDVQFNFIAPTGWTTGMIAYASSSSVLSRLTIGASNTVLNVTGGIPAWTAISNANLASGAFANIVGIGVQNQTLNMNGNIVDNVGTLEFSTANITITSTTAGMDFSLPDAADSYDFEINSVTHFSIEDFFIRSFDSVYQLNDRSDPAAPAAGDVYFYAKLDGGISKLFYRQSDSTIIGPLSDGGATTLGALDDVVITAVADNEVLAFDSGSGDWINQLADEANLVDTTTTQSIGGTKTFTGTIFGVNSGTINLGDSNVDNLAINAKLTTNLIPDTATIDLGDSTDPFRNIVLLDGFNTSKLFFDGGVDTYITGSGATGRMNFITNNDITMHIQNNEIAMLNDAHLRFTERVGDPTQVADSSLIYAKDVSTVTHLFTRDSDGTVHDLSVSGGGTSFIAFTADADLNMGAFDILTTTPPATNLFRIIFDGDSDSDTYISNSTAASDRINIIVNGSNVLAFVAAGVNLFDPIDMNGNQISEVGSMTPVSSGGAALGSASLEWDTVYTERVRIEDGGSITNASNQITGDTGGMIINVADNERVEFWTNGVANGVGLEEDRIEFLLAGRQHRISALGTSIDIVAENLSDSVKLWTGTSRSNENIKIEDFKTTLFTDQTETASLDLQLVQNNNTPANGRTIGNIHFIAEDSGSVDTIYGIISVSSQTITNGAEQGLMQFGVVSDAVVNVGFEIQGEDNDEVGIRFYGLGSFEKQQNITGSRGGNAALADLLQSLENFGLINDLSSS